MSFWSKLASVVLIALIGATASVVFVLGQGERLRQEVEKYPADSTEISLSEVSEDRSTSVLSALGTFADAEGMAIVRVDQQLSNVDGTISGMRVGIVANPNTPPAAVGLSFLGTTLFDTVTIAALLDGDPAKSIGLDANAEDVIADIPALTFAPRISVVQLAHLVETSGTINGTYRIVGADQAQLGELLGSLEAASGQSSQSMLDPSRGQATDSGLASLILLGCAIAASLLLLLLLMFEALRSFPVLGVHLLLGRSMWGFAVSMFRPVLIAIPVVVVLSMLLTLALAQEYQFNVSLVAAAWSGAVIGMAPVLACVVIAAAVLLSTKPVNAILGRYSKRPLLWAIAGVYVLVVAGFSATLIGLDGPIKEAGKLSDVGQNWTAVQDQQILYSMNPGDDQASMSGQSSQLAEDFFRWYGSIAEQPGVTLIKATHYDQQVLNSWSELYEAVPELPFWYMAASPSYLAEQGFPVSDDAVARAKQGARVFLLPDTWADSTTNAIKGWLSEDSRASGDPSIRTKYFDSETVGFEEYAPKADLFSWTTDPALPQTTIDPVILITTPENMIPFESESLYAVGLENSYVKLSAAASQTYISSDYLAEYHLDDNQLEFLPVSGFIAGLTKTIRSVLQLFGGVIIVLGFLLMVTLMTMTQLFSSTYREELAVKRMLGYSLFRLFAPAILTIAVTGLLAVLAGVVSESKSAVFGSLLALVVQIVLVTFLVRRYSRAQLSATLKE